MYVSFRTDILIYLLKDRAFTTNSNNKNHKVASKGIYVFLFQANF